MFQKNVACRPLENLSTWRQISLATWEKPSDPSVYGQLEIDMTRGLKLIERLRKETSQKISPTHLVIKAAAMTLDKFPDINVLIRRNRLFKRDHIDVFVQVFVKEDGKADLSGAKIRGAHQKSLMEIAEELDDQATKIREGKDPNLKRTKKSLKFLTPRLLKWALNFLAYLNYDLNISPKIFQLPPDPFGAVMVTNVGMFGLKSGWAPLVPFSRTPTILLVGEVTNQPAVEKGEVVVKPMLNVCFTIDHRIIDGYLGGKGAGYLKDLLENPEQMI